MAARSNPTVRSACLAAASLCCVAAAVVVLGMPRRRAAPETQLPREDARGEASADERRSQAPLDCQVAAPAAKTNDAARGITRIFGARSPLARATPSATLAFVAAGWTAREVASPDDDAAPSSSTEARPVAPPPNLPLARSRYTQGLVLFKADDYEGALVQFQQAFAAAPVWGMRFNMANLHRHLGQPADAREELEAYLAEGGADVPADRRREAETILNEIDRELASAAN